MAKQKDNLVAFPVKIERNFSQGTARSIQNSVATAGSYRLALNMDSDTELGSLVIRPGITQEGTQRSAGYDCYGIGSFAKTQLTETQILLESGSSILLEDGTSLLNTEEAGKKLFGVFATASDNTIFDMLGGTDDLTGDTKGARTRFCSYLDSIVRVNGVDAPKSYAGTWITTGGAFDLANMPTFNTVIEWKDRVYGALVNSDKLSYSAIANPSTRTISWTDTTPTSGTGYIMISQEDGGGGIQALEKVPGYLLIFKSRTMKRWDGSSVYPEDLVNQGVYSQECVTRSRENAYFINQKGIWVTNGGYPVRISRPVQDFIDAITNWDAVSCAADDIHVFFSIGDIAIGNDIYNNCVLKYNIEDKTFDIRTYYQTIDAMAQYTDSIGANHIAIGDNNGKTYYLNRGISDDGKAINWTVETHQMDWGRRGNIKIVQQMFVYTENISSGTVLWRNSGYPYDYKLFGIIDSEFCELNNPQDTVKGNYLAFKFTGNTKTEQVKFLGFEFPEKAVLMSQNTNE